MVLKCLSRGEEKEGGYNVAYFFQNNVFRLRLI